ncbi:MAG: copper ion binding protein, partial [Paracoccaceae bacterium]
MPFDATIPEINTLKFQVDGLSCASCVGRSEKAITSVDGVAQAAVNLATGQASVNFSAPATPELILAATAKAGYSAKISDISFEVDGATCASCVLRIEKALETVDGVTEATMNLATGRANITLITGSADRADLVRAVESIGYKVNVSLAKTETHPIDRHAETAAAVWSSLLLAAVLTLPVFAVEMGGHIFPAVHQFVAQTIGMQTNYILQFILTTIVLIGPGRVFFTKGVPALLRGAPDMNSLVALGASAAWAYSTVATFAPALLPEGTRNVYFESAAVIVTLILLGRYLEARANGRTGDAIKGLLALAPDTAAVMRDSELVIL